MRDLPRLLLVDDDDAFRDRLARALRDRDFEVVAARSVVEARALAAEAPDYAVVDLRLPEESGLDLVAYLLRLDPHTRVVMLTGYGSIATAIEATRLGAVAYLMKPTDADSVVQALRQGIPAATDAETPTLARAEWEYIQRVLVDCNQNISEAARRLGIHRRSLQRKLQKYPPTK